MTNIPSALPDDPDPRFDRDLANPNFTAANRDRSDANRDAGLPRMDTGGSGQSTPNIKSSDAAHGPDGFQALQGGDVRAVMTADVEVCNPDTSVYYIARMMEERDCGAIPVVQSTDSMRPVGIITDRDIVIRGVAKNQDVLNLRASDVMSVDLLLVQPDMSLDECVRDMEERQLRRAIVVDHKGRACGIISQADIARHTALHQAGELVKEVSEPNPDSSNQHYH